MVTCAGFIIYRKKRGVEFLLLKQREGGHFSFPKGHNEKRETLIQTARRELFEETGIISVTINKGFKHLIKYKVNVKNKLLDKEVHLYLGEVNSDTYITLSDEHTEYSWLKYTAARKCLKFDNQKEILQKAFLFLV